MTGPAPHRDPAVPRAPARHRTRTAAPALVLVAALAACSGQEGADGAGNADATTTLTVLAAASLTDVLAQAQESYEEEHGDVELRFSFAGSQELAAQVREGMRADVLVTADTVTMDAVAEFTRTPAVVATNELAIVTAPDNPRRIEGITDLADDDLTLVLAAPEVPAGRYAQEVLADAGVTVSPASEEASVRSVLAKVTLGEADAGVVYATDAVSAGSSVATVPLPEEHNVLAEYPAAVLSDAPGAEEATAFVEWLASERAQDLFTDAGFRPPDA